MGIKPKNKHTEQNRILEAFVFPISTYDYLLPVFTNLKEKHCVKDMLILTCELDIAHVRLLKILSPLIEQAAY